MRIRNVIKKASCIFAALAATAMCMVQMPAMAAVNDTSTINFNRTGSLTIDYQDSVEGEEPIKGAGFTLYKIATFNDNGGYTPVIPYDDIADADKVDGIAAAAQEAYNGKTPENGHTETQFTLDDGLARFTNIELGLYVVVETSPAAKHFASTSFIISFPYVNGYTVNGEPAAGESTEWLYNAEVKAKPLPAGDLVIEKTVSGNSGETDRDFHFTVTFKDYDEPVKYTKSDGTSGEITSGGSIALKHNESATLTDIPVGTAYTVVEAEADSDGYTTVSTGSTGYISRKVIVKAGFVNDKRTAVPTGDSRRMYISLAICIFACVLGTASSVKCHKLRG